MTYPKYKRMIYCLANSWHRSTKVDREDLISEANLAFCEALRGYNSDKASFSTWLHSTINLRLRKYTQTALKNITVNTTELEFIDRGFIYYDEISSLSVEAQKAVNTIINDPDRFFALCNDKTGKISESNFCSVMVSKGVPWDTSLSVRQEIKTCLGRF